MVYMVSLWCACMCVSVSVAHTLGILPFLVRSFLLQQSLTTGTFWVSDIIPIQSLDTLTCFPAHSQHHTRHLSSSHLTNITSLSSLSHLVRPPSCASLLHTRCCAQPTTGARGASADHVRVQRRVTRGVVHRPLHRSASAGHLRRRCPRGDARDL
jgi:hypothetical protein